MDVNTLRIVATLACFVTFIGIVVWAWSRRNQRV
jgi:cytochrome c oxidase cbb3-type subunit 4